MTNLHAMHTQAGPSQFPTTRWTLVVAAGDHRRKEANSALVSLCESYWYPLYAYLRRCGHPADQSQDLTQEFFMRVLGDPVVDRVLKPLRLPAQAPEPWSSCRFGPRCSAGPLRATRQSLPLCDSRLA